MMNRHFIFALCTVLGFSVSGISMAQSVPTDKEAAARAAKAAKVKFRWGKSLKSAQKQAAETGLPLFFFLRERPGAAFVLSWRKKSFPKRTSNKAWTAWPLASNLSSAVRISASPRKPRRTTLPGVPAMVVVDAEGKELGRTGYVPGRTPAQYVEFFKKYAPKAAEGK